MIILLKNGKNIMGEKMIEIYINSITAREVLDSRGQPTVEAEVCVNNQFKGRAIVASGASTGKYEALELRDKNSKRYFKKGVLTAVENVKNIIGKNLKGKIFKNIYDFDKELLKLDYSENKSQLGANSMLAVSMAYYKAIANCLQIPLNLLIGGIFNDECPMPMLNIINGGAHANNNLDIQEFMIVPVSFENFKEALRASSEVYHALKDILKENNYVTSVGDEGGFAPNLKSHEEALDLIIKAIQKANYQPSIDFKIALDAASSEWKKENTSNYFLPKSKKEYTSLQLIQYWEDLCNHYPICSIEDGLAEEDYEGWKIMTQRLKDKIMLVGDDLFVTNISRLKEGINQQYANAILIKPNQIGTIYETLQCIKLAKKANYKVILSHRSGESEDTTISFISVGVGASFIKSGAPCRSERVAKYNELLRIEETI